jgi:hypothetical protein
MGRPSKKKPMPLPGRIMALGDKGDRCIGLTTLSPSCAKRLQILGASTSWSTKGLSRPVNGQLSL